MTCKWLKRYKFCDVCMDMHEGECKRDKNGTRRS
jgi:hypothetical protein